MARRAALLLVLSLAGCGLPARAGPQQPERPLVAAVRTDAPPFGWLEGEGGRHAGFDVDLARALAQRLAGPEAKLRLVPPAAAAEADLVLGRPPGPATTRPYLTAPLALLVKRGAPIRRLRDVDGRLLALVHGTGVEARLAAATAELGVRFVPEPFATYPLALAAVGEGRAEALAGEAPVLRALALLDPNRRVVAVGWGQLAYAVQAPPRLLSGADAALAALMADQASWARLLRRWGLR